MNLVQRFFIARDLLDLLVPLPRPRPATFSELLIEMESEPALRDWVLAREGPTMAYDSKPLPGRPISLPLVEIQLLNMRRKVIDLPDEEIDQWVLLTHKIAQAGEPVRTTDEQKAALQYQLNAWVLQDVGDGPAPLQNDAEFIARAQKANPRSTWRMVNEAIRMLPQAPRRFR